jgi:Protein kinase domain
MEFGTTSSELIAGAAFGRYRLQAEVGRGGMGTVYLAREEQLGRSVAVKVLGREIAGSAEFRARFAREMRIAARLEHPNVVPVYEAGEIDGRMFIAMRYVNGPDLGRVLAGGTGLEADRVARLGLMIGAALDAAHAMGLVHRDVKPANVLLAGSGRDEHAYLTDFGLSREADSESGLTHTGQWMGTADYVSPEQLDGKPISARSDIYSMACLLFHALSGAPPFAGTLVSKLKGHALEPLPRIGNAYPHHVLTDAVLKRGAAKDPENRYASAGDFARAFDHAVRGQDTTIDERSVATGVALSGIRIASGAPTTQIMGGATRRESADDKIATPADALAGETVFDERREPRPEQSTAVHSRRTERRRAWIVPVAIATAAALVGAVLAAVLLHSPQAQPARAAKPVVRTTTVQATSSGDTAPATASTATVTFHSPSNNVSCVLSGDGATCTVASIGESFVLPDNGEAAYTQQGSPTAAGAGKEAAYGSQVTNGPVTCEVPPESVPRGITCSNASTGHGFEASGVPDRQTTY